MNKTESDCVQEMVQRRACLDCPHLADRTHSWKQMIALTACIMGVLILLSVALVVILTRFYPYQG